MTQLLPLFIFLPLGTFIISLFFNNRQEKQIAFIVQYTKAVYVIGAVAFAVSWLLHSGTPISQKLLTLYQTPHFVFAIQFYYDEITAVYSIVGAVLFFLVSTFSRYYMHRDEGFKRFFSTILFFASGYNLIIFSGNFETLFIGWEFIGLSSFLLIAFYRNRYLPVKNAFKTLSIYRLSDIALILAMWMLHHLTHQNISFTQLAAATDAAAPAQHTGMAFFIAAMIVLAALAKSAQFPFTSWLPRAMEGPTSSSAIFYGSLSVHIGVFLLLRTYPFWQDMVAIKITIIVVGAITGIVSSLIAKVQPTVKTQIAYSSAAQIGIIFIEVAAGLHWLALLHFAGNAFLRTYQLLVSPSVLNYLIHHQYFHYSPAVQKRISKLSASLYILNIKEWNLDTILFNYMWSPFKWAGRQFQFITYKNGTAVVSILAVAALIFFLNGEAFPQVLTPFMRLIFLGAAFIIIVAVFTSRRSALQGWLYLILSHFFILSAIKNDHADWVQVAMYLSGVLLSGLTGFVCLKKIAAIDQDITLNKFHGYVYEQKGTAFVFLLCAVGILGFPVTAAFIGIDVLFTYVQSNQAVEIILLALCFLFLELAALRIYLRVFLGPHKKLNHPVAFRSS